MKKPSITQLQKDNQYLRKKLDELKNVEKLDSLNATLLHSIHQAQSKFITDHSPKEIFENLLTTLLDLTKSEYGFIGEVIYAANNTPYLKSYAITNIAWNAETRKFYSDNAPAGMEFHNLKSLFGEVMTTGRHVIANQPSSDSRSCGLPEGHPSLDHFLGLPFFSGERLIGMVGIANRSGGYDADIIDFLQPFLSTCSNIVDGIHTEKKRKQAEEELVVSHNEALKANLAKSTFLANMSHEIRTPMNGVLGVLELLQESTEQDENQKELTGIASDSARSLLAIINEILDISKIEAGEVTLENILFNLANVFSSSIDSMQQLAISKSINLKCFIQDDVPIHLLGDPFRLRQVLINLISNAIKFTEEGEVNVNLTLIENSGEQVSFLFEVKDTGVGIPANEQASLFDIFSQVDNSITRKYSGSGLGLSISKQLVEMMGGEIGVNSTEGEGSTFWFTAQFEKEAKQGDPQTIGVDAEEATLFTGSRVLVVDDNETNQIICRKNLESMGIEVDVVNEGQQGVDAVANNDYDLVVMDIKMPVMDGFTATGMIRAREKVENLKHLPIIGLTGYVKEYKESDFFYYGMDAYLRKPLIKVRLKEILLDWLSLPETVKPTAIDAVSLPSIEEAQAQGRLILVAEDNVINQKVILRQLNILGYRCEIASDGKEALSMWREKPYGMVLSDCHMPEMDGYELARTIRKEEKDKGKNRQVIIAFTASALKEETEKCLANGMDGYLSKPLELKKLNLCLNEWLAEDFPEK